MRSKESLLKGLEFSNREPIEYSHDNVVNVMDEWAIQFGEWIAEQRLVCMLTASGVKKWFHVIGNDESYTMEQLFNKFLQETNKSE
jgi:hypothetical protein